MPLEVWKGASSFLKALNTSMFAGKQAAMILECGEPDQHSVELEHRDAIADGLCRFARNGCANHRSHFFERAARGFENGGEIVVYVLRRSINRFSSA